MTPGDLDLIAGWVSLVLTVLVFSYLLGDNVLYRLAVHVLVGVAAGYVAVVAVETVLIPWFDHTLFAVQGDLTSVEITAVRLAGALPLLFGALLLFKFSPRLAPVGNLGLAVVIGVGTAVALVGAVAGTIIPLARDTSATLGDDAVDGVVLLVGVITTLLAFQYLGARRASTGQRPWPFRALGAVGQLFVTVTLGVLYGGVILTSMTVFGDVIREQLQFILDRIGG
ncbi:hypothetical protein [Aggregatilinea lenta]|uniref:hypothetical protein n=1 Tax=Aggregatilinea lenta TaxID=913108 RepID=UPI000E5B81A3|nr:hypothetical protein [Aggregatilinea lenta]